MRSNKYNGYPLYMWADAIARRISDELDIELEDKILLYEIFSKLLRNNFDECIKLIGTTIIEEDYFEECK